MCLFIRVRNRSIGCKNKLKERAFVNFILFIHASIDETIGFNNKTTNVSTTFTWLSSTKFYLPNPCQSIKHFEVSYLEIPSDIAMYKV